MGFEWDTVSEDAVFIIGAGRFGSRAARLLSGGDSQVFVVDLECGTPLPFTIPSGGICCA